MHCLTINVHSPTLSYPLESLRPQDVAEYHRQCPVCQNPLSTMTELKNVEGKALLSRGYCSRCSFSTLIKGPSEHWMKHFYDLRWDKGRPATAVNPTPRNFLESLVPGRKARILDIGCGYGTALQAFQDVGYNNLYAIEHSPKRAKYTQKKLGIPTAHCQVEHITEDDLYKKNGPFDAAYMWHVLEHVFDLNKALETIHEILKPGGAVFFAVPYIQTEPTALLAHFFPHLHAFSPNNLALLLARHHFRVHQIKVDLQRGILISAVKKEKDSATPAPDGEPSYKCINEKMIRDLDVFHTLNLEAGLFVHKYIDVSKGFRYGGRNVFIKDSLYFKWVLFLMRNCQNRPGHSIGVRLKRFILLRVILMNLVPRDLFTFSLLFSMEKNDALVDDIESFVLGLNEDELSNNPLKIEFVYPTKDIPVWGK